MQCPSAPWDDLCPPHLKGLRSNKKMSEVVVQVGLEKSVEFSSLAGYAASGRCCEAGLAPCCATGNLGNSNAATGM